MSDTEVILYCILIVVLLALSAFFSSSETAFIALQKTRLHQAVQNKVKGADRVAKLLEKPERVLSTALFGSNLVNTAIASLATTIAIHFMGGNEDQAILIATIVVTILVLVFGDVSPKTVAANHADGMTRLYARPMEWLAWIFTPFVWVLSTLASGFSKLAGGQKVPHSLASEEEIRAMINVGESEGSVEKDEAEMLHNVFDFAESTARETMVPRTDVIFIEEGTIVKGFLDIYLETPFSRYPVFRENRDNIVGILSTKDILMALIKDDIDKEAAVDQYMRSPYFAPETKHTGELFREMRERNSHLCIVVDEFGGTAGIVTINQLVAEIMGPMGDEYAPLEKDFEIIDAYTYEIDGNMRVDEANDEMQLNLPEGDYETVAGFILSHMRRIPKRNEQVRYKDLKIVIKEMQGVKIERVLITRESHATHKD